MKLKKKLPKVLKKYKVLEKLKLACSTINKKFFSQLQITKLLLKTKSKTSKMRLKKLSNS